MTSVLRPRMREILGCLVAVVFVAMLNTKYFNQSSDTADKRGAPRVLLHFGRGEEKFTAYTVDNDVENIAVFARTGEGKTTRVDRTFVVARMLAGYGMICSCPKPNTAAEIAEWARSAHCSRRLVIVRPDGNWRFNVLNWLVQRNGHFNVTEAVLFLKEIAEIYERGRMTDGGGDSKFFTQMADRINHAVMVIDLHANGSISVERCLKLIQTIPESVHAAQSQPSYCTDMCAKALKNCPEMYLEEVRGAVDLMAQELPALDARPRGSCTVSASVVWSNLGKRPLSELFTGESTITPDCIPQGAIVCIDTPLSIGAAGKAAFVLWKMAAQKVLADRAGQREVRPCSLFIGEAANYLSTSDHAFVSVCRDTTTNVHFSLQSYAGALAEIPKVHFESILANTNTRVYGGQSDPQSVEAASLDFGEKEVVEWSGSGQKGSFEPFAGSMMSNVSYSAGIKRKRNLPPEAFASMLRAVGRDGKMQAFVRMLSAEGVVGHKVYFDPHAKVNPGWWYRMQHPNDVVIG